VSPAQALGKVRASIEAEKVKQLQLFKAGNYTSEREAKRSMVKFRRENERNLVSALSLGDKDKYEGSRQKVIDYNKMLVREGLDKKVGLVNVPVSWERARRVKSAYRFAYSTLMEGMEQAASFGSKQEYDKQERKLMALQRRLGARVGDDEIIRKGKVWEDRDGDSNSRNYFLRALGDKEGALRGTFLNRDNGETISVIKRVAGHNVSIVLEENGRGFSFKIDGSYEKPVGLSTRKGMQIAKATEEMFREIVGNMQEGSVVAVYPYDGDRRGEKRRKAYERFGFGSQEHETMMYGVVSGGVIRPATRLDMDEFEMGGDFNFVEISKKDRVKLLYAMLWGEDPKG
jgi:hypothetical protein